MIFSPQTEASPSILGLVEELVLIEGQDVPVLHDYVTLAHHTFHVGALH